MDGFCAFANKVPFFGFATLCLRHPVVQSLLPRIRRRTVTYGFNAQADVRGENLVPLEGISASVDVRWRDEPMGTIRLNMLLADTTSRTPSPPSPLGSSSTLDRLAKALDGFSGVERRFSVRGEVSVGDGPPVTMIDDYGHHPTEIRATLEAAATAWTGQRIIAVFQPHRYTRVRDLFDDFCPLLQPRDDAPSSALCTVLGR